MRLSLAIGFLLVFVVASVAYSTLPGSRQAGVFNVDPPTPYFHYSSDAGGRGRVLVVHGLDANKSMMNMLCYALADSGFEVFSIDLPGHGDSRTPFNAVRAQEAVARVLDQFGGVTNVLGHSLGGGLLLDAANDRPVGSMVLFSPAPTPLDGVMSPRILLFEGQFDLALIRDFAHQVEGAAAGTFEGHILPWTGHSGALTKASVIEQAAEWLGGDTRQIHTLRRLVLLFLMFVCSMGLGIVLLGSPKAPSPVVASAGLGSRVILQYIAAACLAAVVLAFVHITGWLGLYATDYLIGFVFLTGSALCLGGGQVHPTFRSLGIGVTAAVYVIAVPGLLVLSEITKMTLSDGRLWRFPAIVALGLPLFLADEFLLRSIPSRWKAAAGLLLTRSLIGAIIVTATLIVNRHAAFLLLIVHLVVVFWVILWFASGLIYRRTGDALATALFSSIVQAWLFAALFVTT